jgi:hypothetical protein
MGSILGRLWPRVAFGDDCVAGQQILTVGSTAPDGRLPAAGASSRALARGLLAAAFVVYLTVVAASALGGQPLASRWSAWGMLALGAGAALWSSRGARDSCELGMGSAPLLWTGRVAVGAGSLGLLAITLLALLLPVGAYDALGYRLPAVAQWLDAGAVVWVTGDDPLRNGYPLGLEVLEAVIFRAFDSPRAVDSVAVLFLLAGALSVFGLVRSVGAPRWAASLAFGLFALVPMHLLNAPSGYADAAFSGALVTLVVAVAHWVDDAVGPGTIKGSGRSAVDTGVAAALVIALKPHGFALAGIALAVGAWARCKSVGKGPLTRELACIGGLAATGLFFALRNVWVTGNPLYPLELTMFGRVLFPGEASLDGILTPTFNVPAELKALPPFLRPLWVWLQPHGPATSFDDRLAGFGYAFPLFGLPAIGWVLVRGATYGALPRSVLLVTIVLLACLVVQPFAFWPRFTTWLWGAAALALAMAVTELSQRGHEWRALIVSVSSLLVSVPEALYALAHVKRLDKLGLGLFGEDPVSRLAQVAGIDREFVARRLAGRHDVCRTPWLLGTDDANLDGVVAQLSPRPRMHVIDERSWDELPIRVRGHGCDELIVIGDNPLLSRVPTSFASRTESATAFGRCHVIFMSSPQVNP